MVHLTVNAKKGLSMSPPKIQTQYPPVKVRPSTGRLVTALKEVTKLSKAELAEQSFEAFLHQLPVAYQRKVDECLLRLMEDAGNG